MGIWRICVWPTLGNQGGYHGYYGEGWFFAVGGSERQSVCVCRGEGRGGLVSCFLGAQAMVKSSCVYSEL